MHLTLQRCCTVVCTLFVLLSITATSSAANESMTAIERAKLYPDSTRYIIRRNNKVVGDHTLNFSRQGDTLQVGNGDVSEVKLVANSSDEVQLTSAKGTTITQKLPYSSNHWNANVLDTSRLFNTITGNVSAVDIERIGTEEIKNRNGSVMATHYRYTGDIEADVWYDDAQRWVQLAFKGDDGSNIVYTAESLTMTQL